MKTCTVCHKFIKQPKYCPKHEPVEQGWQFINSILAQRQHDQQGLFGLSQQAVQMQNDLRAQQIGGIGGIGGQSLSGILGANIQGQLGAPQPYSPPVFDTPTPRWSGPRGVGPDIAKWLLPALSWVLNPITKLGLKLGILKNK